LGEEIIKTWEAKEIEKKRKIDYEDSIDDEI
jgi:hypothetical protein